MQIEDQLRLAARKLGFAALGFAAAGPAGTMPIYDAWLADGNAGTMHYLTRSRDLRTDPVLILPGIKSVIVAAARYSTHPDPGNGFSTCLAATDYHNVLKTKLSILVHLLHQRVPGAQCRCCVDSAPVLEREWALRAGIGWRGKQGQVITPGGGACCVMGFILTDAELTQSPQLPDGCGDCKLCRDACPTGAIQDNGLIDARLCVSYLTIEHKEDVPPTLRSGIGASICGCDRCTAVCPCNRGLTLPVMPELAPRPMPSVEECVRMDDDAFDAQFRDTPVWRIGAQKLRNNALIAIQNASQAATTPGT